MRVFHAFFLGTFSISILMSIAIGSSALAQDWYHRAQSGTQVIDVDSTPYLLDLVTRSVGESTTGSQVIAANPYVLQVLGRIGKVDWYFANSLEREIRSLRFEFTGPLYLQHQDRYSHSPVRGPEYKRLRQASVRYQGKVYVDSGIFNGEGSARGLDEINRAFLIIHEAVHAYFPESLSARNFKLRSFVKFLRKIDEGKTPINREDYFLQLSENEVSFPQTVSALDPYRTQIEFLLNTPENQLKTFKQTRYPESLVRVPVEILDLLEGSDLAWMRNCRGAYALLKDILQEALVKSKTLSEFSLYVLPSRYLVINPIEAALEIADQLNRDQIEKVVQLGRFLSFNLPGTHAEDLRVVNYRVVASPALQDLSLERFTSLAPVSLASLIAPKTLPAPYQKMVRVIRTLVQHQLFDVLRQQVFENEAFYQSLNLAQVKSVAVTIQVPIARERPLMMAAVKELSEANVKLFLAALEYSLTPGEFQMIKPFIHFDKF